MRVGVDVGGTNTDAVLMDGTRLVAQAKVPTTSDVTSGILAALEELLRRRTQGATVDAVMLGTTHFTNALLEHKDLTPTAVIRLALPVTELLPPLLDWPDPLREAICGLTYMVHGGHEVDGREVSSLNAAEVREAARDMRRKGVEAVAICGLFSPVNTAHEEEAAPMVREEAPGLRDHPVPRDRPRGYPGAGKRLRPQRLLDGARGEDHRGHPRGHQGPGL